VGSKVEGGWDQQNFGTGKEKQVKFSSSEARKVQASKRKRIYNKRFKKKSRLKNRGGEKE